MPLPQYHDVNQSGVPYLGKPAMAPHEVDGQQAQISELGSWREVAELLRKGLINLDQCMLSRSIRINVFGCPLVSYVCL